MVSISGMALAAFSAVCPVVVATTISRMSSSAARLAAASSVASVFSGPGFSK